MTIEQSRFWKGFGKVMIAIGGTMLSAAVPAAAHALAAHGGLLAVVGSAIGAAGVALHISKPTE